MKTYNNGPRKAMMYGGAAKRKPMMYGGTAMKKPRKKAYGGGMMSAKQGQQNQMQNQMMQQPKLANTGMMAKGGKARKVGKEGPMKSGRKRKDFAALAPPYDKATQADFIAGATGIVRDSKGNPVLDSKGNPVRSN